MFMKMIRYKSDKKISKNSAYLQVTFNCQISRVGGEWGRVA